jgi:hypothetical protein
MPGNPKACREHAWRCSQLAQTAGSNELKMLLIELSKNWLKLATDLERTQALLDQEPTPSREA